MAASLKDLYNQAFYDQLADALTVCIDKLDHLESFDRQRFMDLVFTAEFEEFELKQRMHHTAQVMHAFMPNTFAESVIFLQRLIQVLLDLGTGKQRLEYMCLPAYIEMFGLDDYDSAVVALEMVTQYTSCEFAVRPFILRYPEAMLAQMQVWTQHEDRHVRRLASEGSRPRLPWAMALPELKRDPSILVPLLSQLKQDECEVVRRSVANNLNDIAKDNPEVVVNIAKSWFGNNANTDAVVKHGSRTLLKQAHPEIMALFGYTPDVIKLTEFNIQTPQVDIGNSLSFDFTIENTAVTDTKLRLEYGLYYLKKNGSLARKVFKISERVMAAGKIETIQRQQSFKLISTRVFYPGEHQLSIIINGQESVIEGEATLSFNLND